MPRAPKSVKPRHDPLHVDLEADANLRKFGRVSAPGRRKGRDDDEDGGDGNVGWSWYCYELKLTVQVDADVKSSKRILELAREQLDELQSQEAEEEWEDEPEAGP